MTADKIGDSQWFSSSWGNDWKTSISIFSSLKFLSNSSVVRDELEKITESYVPHWFHIGEQDRPFYISVYFLAGLYYVYLT